MADNTSAINVFANLAQALLPWEKLVTGAAYLIGLMFAFKGIHLLKSYGEQRSMMSQSSIKEPVMYLISAAMLIYFPTGFQVVLNTVYGEGSSVLSYAPSTGQNPMISALFGSGSQFGQSLLIVVQLIGVIAFVRGWILLAKAGSHGQQGGTGKAFTHIFGGVLAINIVETLQIINNTLYGT